VAQSATKCVECGRPLELFSGLTVNGATYHDWCFGTRRKPIPQPRPAAESDQTILRAKTTPKTRPQGG
jgi:hypothetical protein